ncbi:MAG: AAA family ATPase [Bryobacterales bacterium]|nr:AAA family ATPase [Bryobacterales bacterium]
MLTAYERRLVFFYLSNAASRLRHSSSNATGLAKWVFEHESELEFESPPTSKDGLCRGVPAPEWENLREALENQYKVAIRARPDRLARRLRYLGKAMRLSRTDTEILEFVMLYRVLPTIESMVDSIFDSRRGALFSRSPALPCFLGVSPNTILSRLAPDAPLVKSGLVFIGCDGDLTPIARLNRLQWVSNQADSDAQRLLLDEAPPGDLRWSDFDHVAENRDHVERVLKGALQTGASGVNVLVYGPPGTGKTEFCKTLAARLEAPLYTVGESSSHGGGEPSRHERLQELRLVQRLLALRRGSILLFDEMEDLLSHPWAGMPFDVPKHLRAEGSKVFMNRLLEQAPAPTLWTSNSARDTCPTVLRRMMFALELRQPPPKVRTRIWSRQLARHGIESGEEEARAIAVEFDVTPGVAAGVTAAARLGGGTIADVRRGVKGLSRVLSGVKPPRQQASAKFDTALIRADTNPVRLAERLAGSGLRHYSLCLQGPPGTGKSAFVRHLADRLGLKVVQKRASDLMSMWVGKTEKLIAAAFAEARNSEAFLVFDEADSLLADRRFAVRNWEISQVNEMLTWMESHPLPFACTTNFGEHLDPATLRRFTFKIALDYLLPQQVTAAFQDYFALTPPAVLEDLAALTPGDFAVVRRKAELLDCLRDPQELANMLRMECEAKPDYPRSVGFRT